MGQSIQEWTKENLWKTAFSRPYPIKFFKGCLPQILLGPFLNTWAQICLSKDVRQSPKYASAFPLTPTPPALLHLNHHLKCQDIV